GRNRPVIHYKKAVLGLYEGRPAMEVPVTMRVAEGQKSATLIANAYVELDRASSASREDSAPIGADSPLVVGWRDEAGHIQTGPPTIAPGNEETWTAIVWMPVDSAVRVVIESED